MKRNLIIVAILFIAFSLSSKAWAQIADNSFKFKQLTYENVKRAYLEKENKLKKLVISKQISTFANHIYIRAFKNEQIMELWIKPPSDNQYTLLKKYKLCEKSGTFGPKKLKGDKQIPEGFYSILNFDHESEQFLSLGINYPNAADKKRGSAEDDVSLHGGCKSTGTLPLTDDGIKELYVMAVEARAAGQLEIPIHIFPAYLTTANFNKLKSLYPNQPSLYNFWESLRQAFVTFNRTKRLPKTQDPYGLLAGEPEPIAPLGADDLLNTDNAVASAKPAPSGVTYRGAVMAEEAKESYAPEAAVAAPAIAAQAEEQFHHVRSGQTLFSISQSYGVSINQLKQWNKLWSNNIKIGQELKVAPPLFHTVKKGDTLYSIAKSNRVSVEDLLRWNQKSGYNLLVGEKLRVKEVKS